jgi:hypothetical protein
MLAMSLPPGLVIICQFRLFAPADNLLFSEGDDSFAFYSCLLSCLHLRLVF